MAYVALAWFLALILIFNGFAENKDGKNARAQILWTGLGIISLVGASAMAIISVLKPL